MDEYYNKIVSKKTETKVYKKVKFNIIMYHLMIFIFIICLFLMIMGIVQMLFINLHHGTIWFSSGIILFYVYIIIFLIGDSVDPLKNYTINDKSFIYVHILLKEIKLLKCSKDCNVLTIRYLYFPLLHLFCIIEKSLKNSFIFTYDEKGIELIEQMGKISFENISDMMDMKKAELIKNYLEKISEIYSYSIAAPKNTINKEYINKDKFENDMGKKLEELKCNIETINKTLTDPKFKDNIKNKNNASITSKFKNFINKFLNLLIKFFNKNIILSTIILIVVLDLILYCLIIIIPSQMNFIMNSFMPFDGVIIALISMIHKKEN